MANRRVRVGAHYTFHPVMTDRLHPPANLPDLAEGSVVKVINLPGAPPANTMGMCYIEYEGTFAGMVCTNSLHARRRLTTL